MYLCDAGYELKGSNRRECQSDGEWSASDPTCEGIPYDVTELHAVWKIFEK